MTVGEHFDDILNRMVKGIDSFLYKLNKYSDVLLDPPEKEVKTFEGLIVSKFRNPQRPTTKIYLGTQAELDAKYERDPDSYDELFVRIDDKNLMMEKNLLVSKKVFNKVQIGNDVKIKIKYLKPNTFLDVLTSIRRRSYSLKIKGKWF